MVINNSSIESNSAREEGGGIQIENAGSYITNSLISNNQLMPDTISANGAGIFIGNSTDSIKNILINVTISGNTGPPPASCGGGVGMMSNTGTSILNLINCTIAGNYASCGHGIQTYTYNASTKNLIRLSNCIISNGNNDNYFAWSDGGSNTVIRNYTLLEDASIPATGNGNINNTDPLIEALSDNGGPTKTHALLTGSPAIDAGTFTGAPIQDARGANRIGKTDIGAFEYGGTLGLFSNNSSFISLYPNPAHHLLHINVKAFGDQIHLTIKDLQGKSIIDLNSVCSLTTVNISDLPAGLYLLIVSNSQKTEISKFLKR